VPLYYVGLRVTDLDRSLRFYTRVLGLVEQRRGDASERGGGIWVGLSDPRSRVRLELNWYPRGSRYASRYRPGDGLDHVGFALGAVPRRVLEAEYARLRRAGAGPTPVTPKITDGWQACVTDPDGNWIEIFRSPTPAEARAERKALAAARRKSRKRTR
jgi:catechol 2,3-dioxygenase-like lactoylglutathione lyase family enzyme